MNGSVGISNPKWSCSRHGESDSYMHVSILEPETPSKSGDSIRNREVALERHYCMHCFVEKMDALGVRDMDRK